MKNNDFNEAWRNLFTREFLAYPPEPLIRILLGKFPNLSFFNQDYTGKSVIDLGYGDGITESFFHLRRGTNCRAKTFWMAKCWTEVAKKCWLRDLCR